jgi:hypothetical protein
LLQLGRHIPELLLHQVGSLAVGLNLLLGLGKLAMKLAVVLIEQSGPPLQLRNLRRISKACRVTGRIGRSAREPECRCDR